MNSQWMSLREKLLFETPVNSFAEACETIRARYAQEYNAASVERRDEIAQILTELTIDLQSYLPRWHLQIPGDASGLSTEALEREVAHNESLLKSWGRHESLQVIKQSVESFKKSNLLKLSRMSDRGEINNRWGNDAATGLAEAMRKGAILVTTNPIMVNAVRKSDSAHWDTVRDELKRAHPNQSAERRASLMTMQAVLRICRELRPVFNATNGKYGYVSLQISPLNNANSEAMAEEVEGLYKKLAAELNGAPNTLFKIPGTKAGLQTVKRLTAQGIGCTVTVNASVAQNLAFGEIAEGGTARLSLMVVMSGRLDDLVRDELLSLGVANAAEVVKSASVAVTHRSYQLLYRERGYQKSAILTASLRGPWHVEGSITDGSAPIFITCFPDKAAEYDSEPRDIVSRIDEALPADVLASLQKSQIFRQAYETDRLSQDQFDTFAPVAATLDAFCKAHRELIEYNR